MWRWDQGRLLYFQFDTLKRIANVLIHFDGVDISTCEAIFRQTLERQTEMPFLPKNYTIKRNYSRVFQCAFLASFIKDKLIVTDLCHMLCDETSETLSVDDYLLTYIKRFRFPFPAFDGYNSQEQRVYPFCAILKYLIALRTAGKEAKLSLDDIFEYIVGNNCTGLEDIDYYIHLQRSGYVYTDTERRQAREMIIFISQLSILQVYGEYLYLDSISDNVIHELLNTFLNPENRTPRADRTEEYYEMTAVNKSVIISPALEVLSSNPVDMEFIEGKRKRVEHFRVERSTLLRKHYKQKHPVPICCACKINMSSRYPWTDYMLDVHHLLPLSSAVAISSKGTLLDDIVGLCPSCHRAVHTYYRIWLNDHSQDDFNSKQEARDIYQQAIKGITR